MKPCLLQVWFLPANSLHSPVCMVPTMPCCGFPWHSSAWALWSFPRPYGSTLQLRAVVSAGPFRSCLYQKVIFYYSMVILPVDILFSMEIIFKRWHPLVISCGISITRAESGKCNDKFPEWENLDKSQSLQFGIIFTLWFRTCTCSILLLLSDSCAVHWSFGHLFETDMLAQDRLSDTAVPLQTLAKARFGTQGHQ